MGLAACTGFFAVFLQQCSDQTATKHISFPFPRTVYTLHPPLPPSQYFPASTCSAVESLLCRKSFTNSASRLPLPHRQTSHHLTYRNIHTSCTKDVKRHQKMISHQMRRGGGVHHHQQHTLVLVVTLYEVGRHCHYIQHHQ